MKEKQFYHIQVGEHIWGVETYEQALDYLRAFKSRGAKIIDMPTGTQLRLF